MPLKKGCMVLKLFKIPGLLPGALTECPFAFMHVIISGIQGIKF
jgi:hypothetical protein